MQADNGEQKLRPGSTVSVSMIAAKIADALVIPSAAVLTAEDGTTTVMVAGSDGVAHQARITVGFRQQDEVLITSGLQAGQRVVTKGAYGLPDKTKIIVEAPKPAGEAADKDKKDDKKDKD